jgi:hypothetical protein
MLLFRIILNKTCISYSDIRKMQKSRKRLPAFVKNEMTYKKTTIKMIY